MLTPSVLITCHVLRNKHCTCGSQCVTWIFHQEPCPYREIGRTEFEAAENGKEHKDGMLKGMV